MYAPMCWVIPPASPAATRVLRIWSSRLVLPWSTWPMTVTTGALSGNGWPSSSSSGPAAAVATGSAGSPGESVVAAEPASSWSASSAAA